MPLTGMQKSPLLLPLCRMSGSGAKGKSRAGARNNPLRQSHETHFSPIP